MRFLCVVVFMQDKYVYEEYIMPRPSFNNVGLRRDLNLSDLPNAPSALDNLLNNLVTSDDGKTFDSLLKIADQRMYTNKREMKESL